MAIFKPTAQQIQQIDAMIEHYVKHQGPIKRQLDSLDGFISNAESLSGLIHSVKKRMKHPDNLKEKLFRKLRDAESGGSPFVANVENLFTEINDLGGYRILHLHTRQMDKINQALLEILAGEAQCTVIEGPKANVWDQESETYFQSIGIATENNPRMYTSVHYTVQPNSRAKVTIEIQVRTLSEELWGEVDHKFNYPNPIENVACGEQIKVLARVASSCTRLVDSIFASYDDFSAAKGIPAQSAAANTERSLIAIKEALRPQKFLWSMLEHAASWDLQEDRLRIHFPRESRALAEMLTARDPMRKLAEVVSQVMGRKIIVDIKLFG